MFCSACGKNNSEQSRFCENCGKSLSEEMNLVQNGSMPSTISVAPPPVAQPAAFQAAPSIAPSALPKKKKKRRIWPWILSGVALVVLLAGVLVYSSWMSILKAVNPSAYFLAVAANTSIELAESTSVPFSVSPDKVSGTVVQELELFSPASEYFQTSVLLSSAYSESEKKMLFSVGVKEGRSPYTNVSLFVQPESIVLDIDDLDMEYAYLVLDSENFADEYAEFSEEFFGSEVVIRDLDLALQKIFGMKVNEPSKRNTNQSGSRFTELEKLLDMEAPTLEMESVRVNGVRSTIFRQTYSVSCLDGISDFVSAWAQSDSSEVSDIDFENILPRITATGPSGFAQLLTGIFSSTAYQMQDVALNTYISPTSEYFIEFTDDLVIEYTISMDHKITKMEILDFPVIFSYEDYFETVEMESLLSLTISLEGEKNLADNIFIEASIYFVDDGEEFSIFIERDRKEDKNSYKDSFLLSFSEPDAPEIELSMEWNKKSDKLELVFGVSKDDYISLSATLKKEKDAVYLDNGSVFYCEDGYGEEVMGFSYSFSSNEDPAKIFPDYKLNDRNSISFFEYFWSISEDMFYGLDQFLF